MDEVYFCMVLHKEQDRRHFYLVALCCYRITSTLLLLCTALVELEVPLKNALNTLHILLSLSMFPDASTLWKI